MWRKGPINGNDNESEAVELRRQVSESAELMNSMMEEMRQLRAKVDEQQKQRITHESASTHVLDGPMDEQALRHTSNGEANRDKVDNGLSGSTPKQSF